MYYLIWDDVIKVNIPIRYDNKCSCCDSKIISCFDILQALSL